MSSSWWPRALLFILLGVCGPRTPVSARTERNPVHLVNNGYEHLLIAISNRVLENEILLECIKEYFIDASAMLYKASRKRAYFRNITILIPDHWQRKWLPAFFETYGRANIIVDEASPQWGDGPYTSQKGGCGEQGDYTHLTPEYLLDRQKAEKNFGPIENTLVHEWGHLRWGLFNEHPGEKFPHCAVIRGNLVPVKCALSFNVKVIPGGPYRCRIYPDTQNPGANASLMYTPYIKKVVEFCDDETDNTAMIHDPYHDHLHNRMCNGRSAWAVMRSHVDFKDANKPRNVADTKPYFRIVQRKPLRTVVVLDVSGSMSGSKLQNLRRDTRRYINNILPNGSSAALVKFSDTASVLHAMITVRSQADRDSLVRVLPRNTEGSTCIGCGILKGIQVLEVGNATAGGGILQVMTDGEENVSPYIREVRPKVFKKKVIVDSILYTRSADHALRDLSRDTGGVCHFVSGESNGSTNSLYNALADTVRSRINDVRLLPVKLYTNEMMVNRQRRAGTKLFIDSSITKEVTFTFTSDDNHLAYIDASVQMPSGAVIDSSSPYYSKESDNSAIYIALPHAEAGRWTYSLSNTGSSTRVKILVEGKAADNDEPVMVTTSLSSSAVYLNNSEYTLALYAEIKKRFIPLVGATVFATIERPGGSVNSVHMKLHDNGAGADLFKDDGTYSAFFTQFEGDGLYNVKIDLTTENTSASLKTVTRGLGSGAIPIRFYDIKRKEEHKAAEPLQRTEVAGFFDVKGSPPNGGFPLDVIPPSKIRDLNSVNVNFTDITVELIWTSVGDDLDNGRAAKYDLRMSEDQECLRYNFSHCDKITEDLIITGNLSNPKPAGQKEKVVVKAPDTNASFVEFFYAIKAIDEADNKGDVSNIFKVEFYRVDKVIPNPDNPDKVVIIVGVAAIAVGVILVIIAIVGFVSYRLQKSNKVVPLPATRCAPVDKHQLMVQHI